MGLFRLTLCCLLLAVFCCAQNICQRNVTCVPFNESSCMGLTVPHTQTSYALINGENYAHQEIINKLKQWSGLRQVPQCWDKLQPLLCALYMPKCENGNVELPSRRMCQETRSPCRIVEVEQQWPSFLQCDSDVYADECENTYQTVNSSGAGCQVPLVATDNERSWYQHVDGCGIQCKNILFDEGEHVKMHIFIAIMAGVCLVLTFFTLATFCADWKNSGKYPAVILFYMNGCFFMASVGFLAQFPSGAREDIVCRSDGTMRIGEPSEGENLSCLIVFVIVYYFIMASMYWFIVLSYAWHLSFRALGTPVDALQGKTGYFHLISWTFPFIMIVIVLAFNQVDGDSLMGICFVGYVDKIFRGVFVLLPMMAALLISGFFLFNGLITLFNLDKDNPGLLNDKAATRIRGTIARIGVFGFLNFSFVLITLACHTYDFTNQARWERGIQDYLYCHANVSIELDLGEDANPASCVIKEKPSLTLMMVHLFSFFAAGITMSTWVWTPSSVAIWKRTWRKITCQPINEPIKLKKSKMIAKAFAKKMQKKEAGQEDDEDDDKMSVSFESASHDDAVGMKFDLTQSEPSIENSSSTWGNNVPVRMLARRGAAMPVVTISNSSSPVSTPDSAAVALSVPNPHSIVETQAIIEAPPPAPKRKRRSRRMIHQPGRAETPMVDDFQEDNEDFITLNNPGENAPQSAGSSGRGGMSGRRGSEGQGMEQSWMRRGSSAKRLERIEVPPLPPSSRVPKLPAIPPTRRTSLFQPSVKFELPDDTSHFPPL